MGRFVLRRRGRRGGAHEARVLRDRARVRRQRLARGISPALPRGEVPGERGVDAEAAALGHRRRPRRDRASYVHLNRAQPLPPRHRQRRSVPVVGVTGGTRHGVVPRAPLAVEGRRREHELSKSRPLPLLRGCASISVLRQRGPDERARLRHGQGASCRR